MSKEQALPASELRRLFRYDPETGVFTRLVRTANCVRAGHSAGSVHPRGYVHIKICRFSYAAHRLAWLYVHGRWPEGEIDHRNGVRSDNRLSNIRECDRFGNQQNTTAKRSTRSGFRGVGWHASTARWRARISRDGVTHNLGEFDSPEDAAAAYMAAKKRLHEFQPVPRDALNELH